MKTTSIYSLIFTALLAVSLFACGGGSSTTTEPEAEPTVTETVDTTTVVADTTIVSDSTIVATDTVAVDSVAN